MSLVILCFSVASFNIFSSFAFLRNWIEARALARKERGFWACITTVGCGVGAGVGGGSAGAETGAEGGFCGSGAGIGGVGICSISIVTGLAGASGATGGIVEVSETPVLVGTGSVGLWMAMGAPTGTDCGSAGVCVGSLGVMG